MLKIMILDDLDDLNKTTMHNKRYSKCGYSCSLKHMESIHTFVLADS
jgi:hypothetical protein